MGLFQSDNYWKKKARSAKLQSAPLDPEAAWRKAVTSSTLWLVGGIALIAFYLSGARAGVVTIDSGVMILLVLLPVSGFGAGQIVEAETGLQKKKEVNRCAAA